jgi:hypothetical protein
MALDIYEADMYIDTNVIDSEDWAEADEAKKERILNVASRTLTNRFKNLTVPDDAVYEFCAFLAMAFNDTNKLQQQGVSQFAVSGISFTFDGKLSKDLSVLIPEQVFTMVGDANGMVLSRARVGRSVR